MMKIRRRCFRVYKMTTFALMIMSISLQANARTPKFSIVPQSSSTVVLSHTIATNITYIVTRNLPASSPAITPTLYPIPGIAQVTSGVGACPSPLTTLNKAGDSCLLMLSIDGSQFDIGIGKTRTLIAPKICIGTSQLSCSQPSAADLLKLVVLPSETLSISAPTLTLAQAGIFTSASGAGLHPSTPRTLTITNTGSGPIVGFTISFSPALSGGASYTTTCTNPLPAGTCTVTISPGSTTSTLGLAPVTNIMTVSGTNSANAPTSAITTITYGSLYGGGYVFSIDDTPPATMPMGVVKVAETINQSSGIVWDADPACSTSCTYSTDAISSTDGYYYLPSTTTYDTDGNTFRIWNVLTNTHTTPTGFPEPLTSYAAGLCIDDSNGPPNPGWYLPAICEMGYTTSISTSSCGSEAAPSMQNMQANLIDVNPTSSIATGLILSPGYWSSTEGTGPFVNASFFDEFNTPGSNSQQDVVDKNSLFLVRCVRAFIP